MQGSYASKHGALPAQTIRDMMRAGFIVGGVEENVAPASLDLTVSDEIYRTDGMFQLHYGETVRELLGYLKTTPHQTGTPLERDITYLARLNESVRLPSGVYGYCNPKSSTGRVDVHVRVLADRVPRYDSLVPGGWQGELWIVIHPKSFPVLLAPKQALSQLRLFTSDTRLSELDFQIAQAHHRLLWRRDGATIEYSDIQVTDRDGAPILSLEFDGPMVGWVSRRTDDVLDLGRVGARAPEDFFEEVRPENGYVRLERGKFYILSTDEAVRVPPEFACEMAPMDERSGDFRSHYAGFIDPGWGWGAEGEGVGRPLTLEVRPFEDLVVRHGQPIAKIKFERMTHTPDTLYDTRGSNYTVQRGPRLAKQFRVV
ncbi:MAG: 2'-deoxycytidine 5'-triphosphate deaminase [Candidatus Pacebacteria bacterium]|nr:2'-deoxycytidine 5'-triphosphate deaminase [Candidatus Paceibacterota bacterium]